MIAEAVSGTLLASLLTYWITHRDTTAKKIHDVFVNSGISQVPMFSKRRGNVFLYKLPPGLTFDEVESREKALKDAFPDRHIDMSFKEALRIVVSDPLPDKVDYVEHDKNAWKFALGVGIESTIYHDFAKIPHMLVCGMTQYGKSTFEEMLTCSIITKQPEMTLFAFLDLKGGVTFGQYEKLNQCLSVASNVEESVATLDNILHLVLERQQYFRKHGLKNIRQVPKMKRVFIVVDEAAELSSHGKKGKVKDLYQQCELYLSEIARLGGGLGFHLIYATQYPHHKVLSTQIKQNCDAVVSFRLKNTIADRVVFDESDKASKLPFTKGRAIYQTDREKEFQAYYMSEEMIADIIEKHKREDVVSESTNNEGESAGGDTVIFR